MWTVKDLEAPRSTQDVALAHVRSNYNHERLIFFSKNQTNGYGTNGRAWVSSDRSLAASMVFPLNFNIEDNAPKLLPHNICFIGRQDTRKGNVLLNEYL